MGVQYQPFTAAHVAKGINGNGTNLFASAKLLSGNANSLEDTSATVLVKRPDPMPASQNAGLGVVALDIGGISALAGIYIYLFLRLGMDTIMPAALKPKGKQASI